MRSNVDKYFEGYVKVEAPKKKGKGTTSKFEYLGEYYHIKRTKAEMTRFKLEFALFYVAYIALYFYTSFMNTEGSHTGFVGVFSLVILIPIIYWLGGLWNFMTAPEYMEIRKYRYGLKRMVSSTKAIMYLSACQVLGEIVFLIIKHKEVTNFGLEFLFMGLAVVETAIVYILLRILKTLEVEETVNTFAENHPELKEAMKEQEKMRERMRNYKRRADEEDLGLGDVAPKAKDGHEMSEEEAVEMLNALDAIDDDSKEEMLEE